MKKATTLQPTDYHSVTPYLTVKDAFGLIDFLKTVFDAQPGECIKRPDGIIMHAEVRGERFARKGPVLDGLYGLDGLDGRDGLDGPVGEWTGEMGGCFWLDLRGVGFLEWLFDGLDRLLKNHFL